MMSEMPLFDSREGQRRAEHGQDGVTETNKEAVAYIGRAFLRHLHDIRPEQGSLDTLRASGFELPQLTSGNAIGAAIGNLARKKLITCTGVTRSSRPETHSGKLFLWRLAEDVGKGGDV